MLAANYSTLRSNLKDYCDRVYDENEIVLVTRKEEKNVVLMSLEKYNQLEKELKNAKYVAKIERGFAQIKNGRGIVHELIEE
ncbi:MAG: type II toxin-antitoxin system prevent-host-death family antitoxin [Lachnospiraceae bacterium]|nr:type II toxin-antitoxin system prevent-host-death family antitoxin [Lachnospiraceae bacterium]